MAKTLIGITLPLDKVGHYHQDGVLTTFKPGDTIPEGVAKRLKFFNPSIITDNIAAVITKPVIPEKPKKPKVKK